MSIDVRPARRAVAGLAVVALAALVLTACGGGGDDSQPRVLEAGQVDVKLPAGFKVVNEKVVVVKKKKVAAPKAADEGKTTDTKASGTSTPTAPGGGGTTPTTSKSSVPISKDSNPTEDLLKSFAKFRDCLNEEHVKFIGAPDASNPESPTNDPDYIKALSTCAARSNIVQALQAAQAEQDTLTPAQIKERNKGYLAWRECMVNRGWGIPKPTPDSKGRLFAFGAGNGPQLKPPAGKDLFNSKDIEQCSAKAQRATQRGD
jgi:hypothetical protein